MYRFAELTLDTVVETTATLFIGAKKRKLQRQTVVKIVSMNRDQSEIVISTPVGTFMVKRELIRIVCPPAQQTQPLFA